MKYYLSKSSFVILCFFIFLFSSSTYSSLKKCVYVNSYHRGYTWSDEIEDSIKNGLKDTCSLTILRMNTKRNKSKSFGKKIGLEIYNKILNIKPNILIASDDNASKYLILPYFKNVKLPVVFNGVNWTATHYGYPYNNATGMIEVSPIMDILHIAMESSGNNRKISNVAFLGVKGVSTDQKEFKWMKRLYNRKNIKVNSYYAVTTKEWKKNYIDAQKNDDLIILNNIAGIKGWNKSLIIKFLKTNTKVLTATTYDFMMPYTILGLTKVAREQGEWSVKLVKKILNGKSPFSIPVVANRKFNVFINQGILQKTQLLLPEDIVKKAVNIEK